MSVEQLALLISTLSAAVVGWLTYKSQHKANNADAAGDLVHGAVLLSQSYKAQIDVLVMEQDEMKETAANLRKELDEAHQQIERLQHQMEELGDMLAEYRQGIAVLNRQVRGMGGTPFYTLGDDNARE